MKRAFRTLLSFVLVVAMCMPSVAWASVDESESDFANRTQEGKPNIGDGSNDDALSDSSIAAPGDGDVSVSDDKSDKDDFSDANDPKTPSDSGSVADGEFAADDGVGSKEDLETEVVHNDESEAEKQARSFLGAQAATGLPNIATIGSSLDASQVIDVPAASSNNSVGLQMYEANTTPAQRFRLEPRSDGFYTIVSVGSGKVLDVRNASAQVGAVVQQYSSNGTDAQAWKFLPTGKSDDSCYLVSKLGETLVLEVAGGSATNTAPLLLGVANGSKSQQFLVQGVSAAINDGIYNLGTLATATVLDVSAANKNDGANIQMYAKNGTSAQTFSFTYDTSTGYYTISTFASGKALDVVGASSIWGSNVQQYGSNGTSAQKWTIEKTGDGKSYNIFSACGGLALDVAGASGLNGANVQVHGRNDTNAQAWTIDPLPSVELEGLFTIHASANKNYVVDIALGGTSNGANVQLYSYNGTWAQKFQIKIYDSTHCAIYSLRSGKALGIARGGSNVEQNDFNGSASQLWLPVNYGDGVYGFQSKETGRYLDITGANVSNGANIQVWEGNGSAAQRFKLSETDRSESVTEGSYVIKNASSGTVFDMVGAGVANGTRAQLYAPNGTYAQKFKVIEAGVDSYYFVNVHSSKYFDVDTGTKTTLQQWERGEGANQKWKFYPVEGSYGAYYIKSSYTNTYLTNIEGSLGLAIYEGGADQQFILEKTTAFKVYLDAGHGYNSEGNGKLDSGATNKLLGYRECDLTDDLVKRVARELDKLGVEYYVGYGKSYKTRHQDAINMGCSTFLSIHFNSGGGRGVESYIHSSNAAAGSPVFQGIIHPYLLNGTGLANRGTKSDYFAVCGGRLPSVLLEVAFIDSEFDMRTYMSRKDLVACQLALGLKQTSQNNACGWY